ncbi:phage holin family protein [Cerasicoccus maritimus]|uniref:phage holin family protein n=1 Tax=Cerasicoccus maritimus TaxID=490089 RepID=UPI002852B9BF|nr:phage holin family protein [Cerasicoccus maritimus]
MAEPKAQNWGTWFRSWAIIALGVLVAAWTNDGISFHSNAALVLGVLLISLLNVFLRPLLLLFALPFVVMTLGVGIVLINGLLFWLASSVVPGFEVAGFWSAVWGAVVVSITNFFANALLGGPKRFRVQVNRGSGGQQKPRDTDKRDDDVIDV